MERLPWKRFVYKVKLAIGNDLLQAAQENADESPLKQYLVAVFCFKSLISPK